MFGRGSGLTQAELRDAISEHVPDDAVIVTNLHGTKKFIRELDRRFKTVDIYDVAPDSTETLVERHGRIFFVQMDRTDSVWWRDSTARNEDFREAVPVTRELLADIRPTSTDRLRIWRMPAKSDN